MRKTLSVLKWLAILPYHGLVVLAATWLAGYAVRNYSSDDKLDLRSPFRWMMTTDAWLNGDPYWQRQLIERGLDPMADEHRIAWMKRNGGNRVNYGQLGVDAPSAEWLRRYRDEQGVISGGSMWWYGDAWCFRGHLLGIELCAGHNLFGEKNGRCKFWCSLRRYKKPT